MKSTSFTCVLGCALLILAPTGPVQAKSLLAIMSKQAETLQHGLDLASKVGDIGSRTYGVAFTVVPSSTTTYSSGSTIQFNRLKYNQGNGFNTSNYRFTAPAAGMYVFSWSLSIPSSYVGNSNLLKNGSIYHQLNCQKTYQQCGATVTMWLNRGNQVWVTSAYSSIYVYATYSSFSGWKIN
ncbi:caprin-2-like [Crassostrea angulata]|uniref:caprin-2-like n=1 Tax=Magallana angulata TaxID=2784310 RepID=UPI0022B0B99E|nr:caprin-2-like [Crassostrea angulata]